MLFAVQDFVIDFDDSNYDALWYFNLSMTL